MVMYRCLLPFAVCRGSCFVCWLFVVARCCLFAVCCVLVVVDCDLSVCCLKAENMWFVVVCRCLLYDFAVRTCGLLLVCGYLGLTFVVVC